MSKPWFVTKSRGYGATPATWQGWVATLAFVVFANVWSLALLGQSSSGSISVTTWATWATGMVAATVLFLMLARAKTAGAWRWR